MEATIQKPADLERDQSRPHHAELIARIERVLPADGGAEPLPGLLLRRASAPTRLTYASTLPAILVVAQGSKEIRVGDTRYLYDPDRYLITTASLPVTGRIIDASPEKPYMSILVKLDPAIVGSVMVETGSPVTRSTTPTQAVNVSALSPELLDAFVRFARLIESPADARFLAPMIKREIIYRLLTGEQGPRLQYLATLNGASGQVSAAVERIHKHFDQPLRMENLARELGMSVSSFHQHFKAVTEMSPLQFQKQLRLHEARRLMLGEFLDASSAGYRVGYDDTSQFNREYKRFFGEPPMRDVERLRGTTPEPAGM